MHARRYRVSPALDQGVTASSIPDNTNSPLGPPHWCQQVAPSWISSEALHPPITEMALVELWFAVVSVFPMASEPNSKKMFLATILAHFLASSCL